jgi:hypothetical protein
MLAGFDNGLLHQNHPLDLVEPGPRCPLGFVDVWVREHTPSPMKDCVQVHARSLSLCVLNRLSGSESFSSFKE